MPTGDSGYRRRACFLLALFLFAATGCAAGRFDQARQSFYGGRLDHASSVLGDSSEVPGRDRLLYFMEKGVVLHQLGDYAASTRMFRQAVDFINTHELISASRQSGSLLSSERLVRYRGEHAERLWVHTYLMMNYLLQNKPESALVEARQALAVFAEKPDVLAEAHFTRALIAHCFEAMGEINSAYIEYKKLAEALGDPEPVADKLVLLGRRLGFRDEVEKFEGHLSSRMRREIEKGVGPELVIFASQGRAPVKIPHDIVMPPSIRFSFVSYRKRTRSYTPPVIHAADERLSGRQVRTDMAKVLEASLKERAARMMAKESFRAAAKEAVARNIEDDFLEIIVRGFFFVLQEPDTRCWQTLPAYWTMIRVPLPPGRERSPAITIENAGASYDIPVLPPEMAGKRFYYFALRNGDIFSPPDPAAAPEKQ